MAPIGEQAVYPHWSPARPERAILFTVEAWDTNCQSHITARFTEAEIRQATAALVERIATLETELAALKAARASGGAQ